MKKVLLTGATGFLGSHLARALLAQGYQVTALKRGHSNLQRLSGVEERIKFYDLEKLDLIQPFLEQGPFNLIIHTATCYGRAGETKKEIFESNVLLPSKLLDIAIFFNIGTFLNADTVLSPHLNDYSKSKKYFVDWARQAIEGTKTQFVNIQMEHIYGPNDSDSKFIVWLIKNCLTNHNQIQLTSGKQQRDFIYIDDVLSAYIMMISRSSKIGSGFQQISLGSGNSISIRALVELVHSITDSTSQLCFDKVPYRDHELMRSNSDITRIKELGWRPKVTLKEGLTKMIALMKTENLYS